MGIFDKKDRNIYVHYEIKAAKIKMPKEGECIIFKFPKDTPKEILDEWDRRLTEFQNLNRSFITTTMEVTFFKNSKTGNMEVYNEESDSIGRPGEDPENRQDKDGDTRSDKEQPDNSS